MTGEDIIVKKIWNNLARDLWIILLDILAVNAAYLLALLVRFYVNSELRTVAKQGYLPAFLRFAPVYTVLAVLVFAVFRLYGGMWRYAGINDMNRIIGANVVTVLIQVVGSITVFAPLGKHRMPVSYYVIGAVLQFFLILLIRFGYRLLLVEKKKLSAKRSAAIPTMIIGAGEIGRKAIIYLEESAAFRPVVIVDKKNAGKSLNGVPVTEDLDKALQQVRAVFIADPTLEPEERKAVREKTEALGLELQDYSGYLSNLGGKVPLSSLLELAGGPVTVSVDGHEREFESGDAALKEITGRYEVVAIRGMQIELKQSAAIPYAGYDAWAKQHKEETGEDVSFF